MKFLIVLVAVVALVSAEEKKPAADEKPRDDKSRLVWPLPDASSEGDLMLHGRISYDRVRDLHKAKLEDDVEKMILAHGRLFLRRVSKFFDDNADFKVMPILCRDSRNLNSTSNRWRIEIPKEQQAAAAPADAAKQPQQQGGQVQRDAPLPKDKPDKVDDSRNNSSLSNETIDANATTTVAPSSEKPTDKPSSDKPSNDKPTDKPAAGSSTTLKPEVEKPDEKDSYDARRREFYRRVGENFARLLMKEYRKETMVQEETDYLARWIADEAVHYGAWAIYCNENENVKEIKKNLAVYLEEKAQ